MRTAGGEWGGEVAFHEGARLGKLPWLYLQSAPNPTTRSYQPSMEWINISTNQHAGSEEKAAHQGIDNGENYGGCSAGSVW